MSIESRALPEASVDSRSISSAATSRTRPFYWSLRRELWENRSIYLAPLITGVVVLVGFAISAIDLPARRQALMYLDPAQQRNFIELAYNLSFSMIMASVLLVWLFYCLDALYGERRDRSILFWKSLPVSDLTTVLSKACVPLVILPIVAFTVTVGIQSIMLVLSTVVLLMNGMSPATWSQLPLFQTWLKLLYGLVAMSLWLAPIHAWLLMVSAWAKRATLLWAFLPIVGIAVLERVAFRTQHVSTFMNYCWIGWTTEAFADQPRAYFLIDSINPVTPMKFLSNPHLSIGLLLAALFLAVAVRLRRSRGPI